MNRRRLPPFPPPIPHPPAVIDSLLFVLGKKASQLRFKRISELIHRSATYPDLDYARVSVFFQDIVDDGSAWRRRCGVAWGQAGVG